MDVNENTYITKIQLFICLIKLFILNFNIDFFKLDILLLVIKTYVKKYQYVSFDFLAIFIQSET